MGKKRQLLQRGVLIFLVSFALVTSACDSGKRYPGTYVWVRGGDQDRLETLLELKEDGQGIWITNEKEVPFRWSVKGQEIRLHTKEGGVIAGKIIDDTVTIILPGDNVMSFQKKRTY